MYSNSDESEVYHVLIRLSEGAEPIEFEVQMLGLPTLNRAGIEVVAKWRFADMHNQRTFYTDSNGLEMQKRVLNERAEFKLDPKRMSVNVNYFPVNQAIAFRDVKSDVQVSVMNLHSQGGSVVENASIELMQNRRLFHDDDKGVTEYLNEE